MTKSDFKAIILLIFAITAVLSYIGTTYANYKLQISLLNGNIPDTAKFEKLKAGYSFLFLVSSVACMVNVAINICIWSISVYNSLPE